MLTHTRVMIAFFLVGVASVAHSQTLTEGIPKTVSNPGQPSYEVTLWNVRSPWISPHQVSFDKTHPSTVTPLEFQGTVLSYVPVDPPPNGCGFIFLASGGFRGGDPQEYWKLEQLLEGVRPYLRSGYTVFVLNNGPLTILSTEEGGPNRKAVPGWSGIEIQQQLRDAVRFIKYHCTNGFTAFPNAQPFPVNPTKIAVGGGSSGGVLALGLHCRPNPPSDPVVQSLEIPMPSGTADHDGYTDGTLAAAVISAAGADGLNFRSPNDFSWVFSRPQYLIHPDMRVNAPPTPSESRIPASV